MLIIWDNQAKQQAEDRALRLALLAANHVTPAQAFPELFSVSSNGDAPSSDDDVELEIVEYEPPGEDGSNYDKVMAALAAHRRVTTREAPEASEGVMRQPFPPEPDDTEWI